MPTWLVPSKTLKTSGMQMVFNVPLLKSNVKSLKELSKDNSQKPPCFMVEDERPAVDFDAVKDEYLKQCDSYVFKVIRNNPKKGDKYEQKACSVDALFCIENGILVFVEFKNGCLEKQNVHSKIRDSLLIYNDLMRTSLSDTRKNSEFILVYNQEVNKTRVNEDIEILQKDDVNVACQTSSSRDYIHNHLATLEKKEFIQFGIERFQGYCFTKVHTYNENEMKKWLAQHDIYI